VLSLLLVGAPRTAAAQSRPPESPGSQARSEQPRADQSRAVPRRIPPAAEQIAAAVLAAPVELRAGAAVLGYTSDGRLVTLREGTNELICLADDPAVEAFHVACYHRSLEPFMARGRALRAAGVKGPQVDSVRFKEVAAGTLAMPRGPAALYTLTAPHGHYDPLSRQVDGSARALYVVYIPFATPQSTGLSARPVRDAPWVMFPGTPKAHIMFAPDMR
jgi:hypothetical protein